MAEYSFQLRICVGQISRWVVKVVGVNVYREGTGIYSTANRFLPLEVADPCSGIRSLMALMALTSLYGYIAMDQSWKKCVLFLSIIPLAFVGSLARITTAPLVAHGCGHDWALRIYD